MEFVEFKIKIFHPKHLICRPLGRHGRPHESFYTIYAPVDATRHSRPLSYNCFLHRHRQGALKHLRFSVLEYLPPESDNPTVLNFLKQKVRDCCEEKRIPIERVGTITDYKNIFIPLLTELTRCSRFPEFSFGHIPKLRQWRCCRITGIGLLHQALEHHI